MRILTKALAVLVILTGVACADDWSKQFTVSGTPELRVTANDAGVHLTRATGKQISVSVHTYGQSIGPGGVKVTATQSGDTVSVDVREPSMHFSFGIHRSTRIEVAIPEHARVDLKTGDGNIDLDDISGDMHLYSGDGHIVGRSLDGNLDCRTSDGHIELDGRFDHLRVDSGDGHVTATIRGGSKLGNGWNIHTSDGSIELRLPSDLAADLDAHTSDGHIDSDLPIEVRGRIERSTLQGKLNGGGPLLEIRSGDGSIRLRRGGSSL